MTDEWIPRRQFLEMLGVSDSNERAALSCRGGPPLCVRSVSTM